MTRTCDIANCGATHSARGFCKSHYKRWYRYGTPLGKRPHRSKVVAIFPGKCEGNSTEYRSWSAMKYRCYKKTTSNYKYYGGRGIVVCQRWLDDYKNFLEDMGRKPSLSYSLDRIDVEGNYTPENCRWATRFEQARNKRNARNGKPTPFRGVYWFPYGGYNGWRVSISHNGRNVHLGYFKDLWEAISMRLTAETEFYGHLIEELGETCSIS